MLSKICIENMNYQGARVRKDGDPSWMQCFDRLLFEENDN